MSTEDPSAHIEQATINVSEADIVQSPASRRAARKLAYAIAVLFIAVIAVGAANLLWTNSQVHSLQHTNARLGAQVRADCGFYSDLAGLPLASAPNGHPSELGVKLISDSRLAWHGHGCPGHLAPPSPSFAAGARYYRLPVS